MIKETVTYEDFDGTQKTKDLYFHLTEAELNLLNLKSNGRYGAFDPETPSNISMAEQIALFEELIKKAYGQKTADGTFIKNEITRDAFLCSPEYSAFLMKLINGEINVNEFILGCLPVSISKQINIAENGTVTVNK